MHVFPGTYRFQLPTWTIIKLDLGLRRRGRFKHTCRRNLDLDMVVKRINAPKPCTERGSALDPPKKSTFKTHLGHEPEWNVSADFLANFDVGPPGRPEIAEIDRRSERNSHFWLKKGQNRRTPRAKWPFWTSKRPKSADVSHEMAILDFSKDLKKAKIGRRLARNGHSGPSERSIRALSESETPSPLSKFKSRLCRCIAV